MHVFLEGVAQHDISLMLLQLINTDKVTLLQLNNSLQTFSFGYTERKNKPEKIHPSVFSTDSYKLKMNAENTPILCKVLPFILESFDVNLDSEMYSHITKLLAIIQIVYSPVISETTIQELKDLIADYLGTFSRIYPNSHLLPKHHYMVHIPNLVRQCGPPVHSNCMRFEAAHQYFKRIALTLNFKNICKSLSIKYQEKLCADFLDNNGDDTFYASSFIQGPSKLLSESDISDLIDEGLELGTFYSLNWISMYGQKFISNQAFVAVDCDVTTELPLFGELKRIILNNSNVYFNSSVYDTLRFHPQLLAYEVNQGNDDKEYLWKISDILDYNVYHLVTTKKGHFITIKYDLNYIISEHLKGANPLHKY